MIKTSIGKSKAICHTVFETPSGEESVIVFLHGLGSSQNYYYSIAKCLSSKHTCVLLDNEGAGRSPLSSTDISIETISHDVVDLLCELNLSKRPITFVGHSMSGMTVNYISSILGDKLDIRQNVLLGPVHPTEAVSEVFTKRIQAIQKTNSLFDIANTVLENAVGSKCSDLKKAFIRELISGQSTDRYVANCSIIAKAGSQSDMFLELYKKNSNRTLLVVGDEDKTAPWAGCVEIISKNLPNSEVCNLKGIGHWHAIEDDQRVLKAIESFIA